MVIRRTNFDFVNSIFKYLCEQRVPVRDRVNVSVPSVYSEIGFDGNVKMVALEKAELLVG